MSSKGVLITDPRVQELNETQWVFEVASLNAKEQNRYEDLSAIIKAVKKYFIHLIGLNIQPIRDEETGLLREREDHEIIPLLISICREDVAKDLADKLQEFQIQETVKTELDAPVSTDVSKMSADEFEAFMKSDLDFMDDDDKRKKIVTQSPQYKRDFEKLVQQIEGDFDPNSMLEAATSIPSGIKIESEPVVNKSNESCGINIEIENA